VIDSAFPLPWNQQRPILINFDLWHRLSKPQRDLLILRNVSWLTGVKWFKPDIYQGVVLTGLLGAIVEADTGGCSWCSSRRGIDCDRYYSNLAW
jgi:hypothetical protein